MRPSLSTAAEQALPALSSARTLTILARRSRLC
jgi:hypothetical protein